MKTTSLSIKSLYELALAEGEGVGTAYEYYVKRQLLTPWLKRVDPLKSILVAGLPEKYGASLDFLQLATELKAKITIVDDRPNTLERMRKGIAHLTDQGWFQGLSWEQLLVSDIGSLSEVKGHFDLCFSSEVLQRMSDDSRSLYFSRVKVLATCIALFTPNAHNPAHTQISGLSGLSFDELTSLSEDRTSRLGFIDMPPFPPRITRTDEQREQATSGRLEAIAMWGLAYYARSERLLPRAIRKRQSSILYTLINQTNGYLVALRYTLLT